MLCLPCVLQRVLQDVLVHFVLRPAPVRPTPSVTGLLENVCVKLEMTVNKVKIQMDFSMNTEANTETFIDSALQSAASL